MSDVALVEAYPRLYANSINKKAKILEIGVWNNKSWECKLKWRRNDLNGRSSNWIPLTHLIIGVNPHGNKEDAWMWKNEDPETYSVKSAYKKYEM